MTHQDVRPYRLLDTGNFRKLEDVGGVVLARPSLEACWRPALPEDDWRRADAAFTRDRSGSGRWSVRTTLPESWNCVWGDLTLKIKPTNFGHLGFFAEQYANWDFFRRRIPELGAPGSVRALNLFAYSGAGSLAMAEAGAQVWHLDAARGMIEWGRENLALNPGVPDAVHWIVDDVNKFCKREVRRESRYQLIALDPPSFGRGSSGQVWKIEEQLGELLELCSGIIAHDRPYSVVLSCHSPGFSPLALGRMLEQTFGPGTLETGEMTVPEVSGKALSAGIYARYSK